MSLTIAHRVLEARDRLDGLLHVGGVLEALLGRVTRLVVAAHQPPEQPEIAGLEQRADVHHAAEFLKLKAMHIGRFKEGVPGTGAGWCR